MGSYRIIESYEMSRLRLSNQGSIQSYIRNKLERRIGVVIEQDIIFVWLSFLFLEFDFGIIIKLCMIVFD